MFKSQLNSHTTIDPRTHVPSYPIPLHPCRGCIYRNHCKRSIDMNQGDYCRYKDTTTPIVEVQEVN